MPLPTDAARMRGLARELETLEDGDVSGLRGTRRRPQPRLPVVGPDGSDASRLAGLRRESVDMGSVPSLPLHEPASFAFDPIPEMPAAPPLRARHPVVHPKPAPRDAVPDDAIATSVRDERSREAARASVAADLPEMPAPAPVRVPAPIILPKPTPMDSVPDDVIARDAKAMGMEDRGDLELPGLPEDDGGLALHDGLGDRYSVPRAVASLPKPTMPTLRRPAAAEASVTKAVEVPPSQGPEIELGDAPPPAETKATATASSTTPAPKAAKAPVKAQSGPLAAKQQKIDAEEKQRRARLAGQYRADAAKVQAELNEWKVSGQVVPDNILNFKQAVIDRLNRQADEMESTGKASRAPSQTVPRQVKDQVRTFRDNQRSDADMDRLADDIIAENSRSQGNRMTGDEQRSIARIARGTDRADAMERLRSERRAYAGQRRAAATAAQADNAVNYNLARMHPAQRMAAMFRTVAESNSPEARMAAAFAIDPRLAQMMQQQQSAASAAEAQRLAAEEDRRYKREELALRGREVGVAEQKARNEQQAADPSYQLGRNKGAIDRALAAESPDMQLEMMQQALKQEGESIGDPALVARSKNLIADHYARRGDTKHPMVRERAIALAQRGNFPAFYEWASRTLGWDEPTARSAYHNSRTGLGQRFWDSLPSVPSWWQQHSLDPVAFAPASR